MKQKEYKVSYRKTLEMSFEAFISVTIVSILVGNSNEFSLLFGVLAALIVSILFLGENK